MDNGKKFWDRFAKLYAPIQEKSNRILYEQVSALCRPYLSADTRVLELACGTGQLTLPLYKMAGYWEATDFSENMMREMKHRCPEGAVLCVQDATALTYEDGSFHVVLIANALHIMPQPEKALREIYRVLDRDGILLAPTFVYEGKVNRLRMWVTMKLGFPSCNEWSFKELEEFLCRAGFRTVQKELVPGDPLPEGFIAVQKQ